MLVLRMFTPKQYVQLGEERRSGVKFLVYGNNATGEAWTLNPRIWSKVRKFLLSISSYLWHLGFVSGPVYLVRTSFRTVHVQCSIFVLLYTWVTRVFLTAKPIIVADNQGLECLRRRQWHVCKWNFLLLLLLLLLFTTKVFKSHGKLHVTLTLRSWIGVVDYRLRFYSTNGVKICPVLREQKTTKFFP